MVDETEKSLEITSHWLLFAALNTNISESTIRIFLEFCIMKEHSRSTKKV